MWKTYPRMLWRNWHAAPRKICRRILSPREAWRAISESKNRRARHTARSFRGAAKLRIFGCSRRAAERNWLRAEGHSGWAQMAAASNRGGLLRFDRDSLVPRHFHFRVNCILSSDLSRSRWDGPCPRRREHGWAGRVTESPCEAMAKCHIRCGWRVYLDYKR